MDPNKNQRPTNGSATNGSGNPPVTRTTATRTAATKTAATKTTDETKPTATKAAPAQATRTTATRTTATSTTNARPTAASSTATSSTATSSTSTTGTKTVVRRPAATTTANNAQTSGRQNATTTANNAQTSGRQNATRTAAATEGPARTQPRAAGASTSTNTTASTSGPKATPGTAGPKKAVPKPEDDPSLAYVRHIAELAVQRAVLATKTVLKSVPKTPAKQKRQISQQKNAGTKDGTSAANNIAVTKKDDTPVTIADFAVQALLISGMRKAFPDYGFLGEETSERLQKDKKMRMQVWNLVENTRLSDDTCENLLGKPGSPEEMLDIIDIGASTSSAEPGKKYIIMDPVDGTSAFMDHGQYAVVMGIVQDGREIMGVVAGPNVKFDDAVLRRAKITEFDDDEHGLGTMISAVRGHGATARPVGTGGLLPAVPLSRESQPAPKIDKTKAGLAKFHGLQYVDSENSPKSRADKVGIFAGLENYKNVIQLYSSHVRYMAMALGDRTYIQIRWPDERFKKFKPWSIWDHVGTPLIYTESGPGKITDLHGKTLTYDEGRDMVSYYGIITADATIHKAILDAVKVEFAAEKRLVAAAKLAAGKK